ncbi:MAG TPA: hypothetical protein VGU02_05125, partial [Gaiellaceae bacterium]|nr:hypothetical protein [Gaiellaceae bacterium]
VEAFASHLLPTLSQTCPPAPAAITATSIAIVAWCRCRGRGPAGDAEAGQVVAGYVALAIIVTVIASAVG